MKQDDGEDEGFVRETKQAALRLDDLEPDGRFSGYASLFEKIDLGADVIAKGAFTESLERRGAGGIRMLYQHDPAEPIGHWTTIREDGRGLYVEGKLALAVERAREVHALMKSGALDGLSIGFETVRARAERKGAIRRILTAELWEISVVTFPMQPGARVTAVKAALVPTRRNLEQKLTREAGLSLTQARGLMSGGYAALIDAQEAGPARIAAIAARLRRLSTQLRP